MDHEKALAILEEEISGFVEKTEPIIIDLDDSYARYKQVFYDVENDTYWVITWSRAFREFDEGVESIYFSEVVPYQEMVTLYRRIENDR